MSENNNIYQIGGWWNSDWGKDWEPPNKSNEQEIHELEDWIGQLELCQKNCENGTYEWNEYEKQIAEAQLKKMSLLLVWPSKGSFLSGFVSGWSHITYDQVEYSQENYGDIPVNVELFQSIRKSESRITFKTKWAKKKISHFRRYTYITPEFEDSGYISTKHVEISMIVNQDNRSMLRERLYYCYLPEWDTIVYELVTQIIPPQFQWGRK